MSNDTVTEGLAKDYGRNPGGRLHSGLSRGGPLRILTEQRIYIDRSKLSGGSIHLRKIPFYCFEMLALASLLACSNGSSHTVYTSLTAANVLSGFYINNGSGNLVTIPGSPFTAGVGPVSILAHPTKDFVYAANSGEGTISLFRVDKRAGALVEVTPRTPAGIQPSALAMDSGGTLLFVANFGSNDVSVYSIDASSGALSLVTTVGSQSPIALKIAGSSLYVANANASTVSAYSVGSGGSLTPVPGSPFGTGQNPSSITADPSGKFLYVTNLLAGTFSGFAISSSSGGLTPMAGSPYTQGTRPISATTDLSGKYLYVADLAGNEIFGYSIDPNTGIPTQLTGSPFKGGSGPLFLIADSSGKYLLVGNESAANISEFSIDPKTGALATTGTFATGAPATSITIIP